MKKCPFCAEDIQDAAIKCKHCSEFLNGYQPPSAPGSNIPWYYRTSSIIVSVCCVGPLALPLIWFCPQANRTAKAVWTVVILVLTYASVIAMGKLWKLFQVALQQMNAF